MPTPSRAFPSRAIRLLTSTAAAAGLVVASVLPAQAAPAAGFIATPNGMVGVTQSILIKAPKAIGQAVTIQATAGPVIQPMQTTIGSNGIGQLSWTPGGAGPWTITGLGSIAGLTATTITVAAMPVITVIAAPNHLTQGVSNAITAAAIAPIGTLAPTGNVRFAVPNGITLGTAPLQGTLSPNMSQATLNWTPGFSGDLPIQATYVPASGGQLGSTSAIGQPNISTTSPILTAHWPAIIYQGEPTLLQASLASTAPAGAVSFTFTSGGAPGGQVTGGSGSMGILAGGTAAYQWTPTVVGIQMVVVQYSGGTSFSGSVYQAINVQPPRPADNITVTSPAQGLWTQATPEQMASNASALLTGTSTSGTTVLFSETGPCAINGSTLIALGTGTCQVTAFTPGNAQIKPGSETYTINVVAPPKRPARR